MPPMRTVTIRLPDRWYDLVREYADVENTNMSELFREGLILRLGLMRALSEDGGVLAAVDDLLRGLRD